MKFVFQKIICPACVIFTALCTLFSVLLSLSGTMMYLPMMDVKSVCELLAFSLLVACANLLFSSKLPYPAALALHFVAVVGGGFGLIFLLIGKHYGSPSGAWSMLALVAGVYVAAAAVATVVRAVIRKRKRDAGEYRRQF